MYLGAGENLEKKSARTTIPGSFLDRGFVTTELVSLQDEETARTLGVLDVDEQKERFNVKNTHTSYLVPGTHETCTHAWGENCLEFVW